MPPTLAVLAPSIGTVSETFILRHMNDLLPGHTVVVADVEDGAGLAPDCPRLLLGRREQRRPGVRFGRRPRADGRAERASAFLKAHHVEVALGEYLTWSHAWIGVLRDAGMRFFAHAHGYDVSRKLRDPEWRVRYLDYRLADGLITVSEASRQRLIGLGLAAETIHVVPCGTDVPLEPVIRPARAEVRCLAVGRMVPKKGPCLTLEAIRQAIAQCDALRLTVIGGGELLPAAEQFVRNFALEDRVQLLGPQPHPVVQRAMRSADLFVQHSRVDPVTGDEEGLPVSILEAMAHGLPVVSTRHAGIPEAVVEGVTGLLVDEGDADAMAERIVVLARDAELRARMGHAGWQRAAAHFSWEQERRRLLQVLGLDSPEAAATDAARPVVVRPETPLITVVVPAYNRAATIVRCLESVRAQSYPHWEAIVVDDGSADATAETAAALARSDGRIRVIAHQQRRGAQAARNSGIREARGPWVAFLDSDDEFLPHSLEVRLRRGIAEGREVVHSGCRMRTPDGEIRPYHVPRLTGRVYAQLLKQEGPVFPALLVTRRALEHIGLLDEDILAFQEWDTAIRLARRYEFSFEPDATFIYDCRGADAMSRDLLRNGRAYEQVVRKHRLQILRHGGPRAMVQHQRRAERWYASAGAPEHVKRCRLQARGWSCLDPGLVWEKLRVSVVGPA